MHPQRPSSPLSLSQAQDELLSDDFPPFREHKSSPDPRDCSAPQRSCLLSLSQAQDELLSDDFPPFREHKSSPDPPVTTGRPRHHSSAIQKDSTQQSRPRRSEPSPARPRSKGLGSKNICNTTQAVTIRHTKNGGAPPRSISQAQDELLSDDFPPFREHKSSLNPPVHPTTGRPCSCCHSSAIQKDSTQQSRPSRSARPRSKGLGNTIQAVTIQDTKNCSPKAPLKRRSESLNTPDDSRRLKKYRLTSVYEDDMDWIKSEIKEVKNEMKDINACMMEVVEYLKEEVNCNIGEVIYQLQQMA